MTGKMRRISQRFFFHGGNAGLKVGDLLLPPREIANKKVRVFRNARKDRVYLTTDLFYAICIAIDKGGGGGWVYRAEPIGRLELHDDLVWGFDGDSHRGCTAGGPHYTVPKARISACAPLPAWVYDNWQAFVKSHFTMFTGLITEPDVFRKVLDPCEDPAENVGVIIHGKKRRRTNSPMWQGISEDLLASARRRRVSAPAKGTKMTTFESTYSEHDAFYARADLLRPNFGQWDMCDPVAHAILDIVEAQNELAEAFDDDAHCLGNEAAVTAAVEKRHAAGKELMDALEDRESWPDPELGLRDED
jgi:hypothetical protein